MPSPPVSAYTVVRKLLTDKPKMSPDEAITLAKALGVTQANDAIRKVVYWTRSDMRRRKKPKKRAAGTPSNPSMFTLAREIITAQPRLSTEQVLARIKAQGVTKSDSEIRIAINNMRYEVRKKGVKAVPAAARTTAEPRVPDPTIPADTSGESDVLASIALANKTAQLCGGIAKSREIAEAIRSCGGIDAFLKKLELVADILGSETKL